MYSPIKLFSLFNLFAISACVAQPQQSDDSKRAGYSIRISVQETEEDTLYLGFYYKGRTYVTDTTTYQGREQGFVFEKDSSRFESGFFFLLNPKKSVLLDFVVGQDQHFSLSLPRFNEPENIEVSGDVDNDIFFRILRSNKLYQAEAQPFIDILEDSTQSKEAYKEAQVQIKDIRSKSELLRKEILSEYPDQVMSKMIRSSQEIEIPESVREATSDPRAQFYYYRDHFFDHMPLTDSIYLRFPPSSSDEEEPLDRVKEKVNDYLEKLHVQHPDTLIFAIDRIAQLSEGNENMFTYVLWHCTKRYQNPKIMGFDKILVHIYDTYYATGRMDSFANENLKGEIKKVTDKVRLSLIGNIAPDLIMQDKDLQRRSLYKMKNKYRVVYFFNPDCGACAKETPKLVKAKKESPFDVGVFAVCSDTSMVKMKEYIEKTHLQDWIVVSGPRSYVGNYQNFYDAFSTPIVMVIDRENRIIAKKIPSERINDFLKNHEEMRSQSSSLRDP